jgi:hypothetical protein
MIGCRKSGLCCFQRQILSFIDPLMHLGYGNPKFYPGGETAGLSGSAL